jgi:hypothetical protein
MIVYAGIYFYAEYDAIYWKEEGEEEKTTKIVVQVEDVIDLCCLYWRY